MAGTTYAFISEQILTAYYRGVRSDDSSYSIKFIASMVAQEVATMARKNAFENGNNGDVTYANDSFTSTFKNVPVTTDPVTKEKYSVLPSIPSALPNNQEIASVSLNKKSSKTFIPMKNKDRFAQSFLPCIKGVVYYYIEDGKIFYDNADGFIFPNVTLSMVGAAPSGNILDAQLNIPKNYESEIIDKILNRLLTLSRLPKDYTNDGDDIQNIG